MPGGGCVPGHGGGGVKHSQLSVPFMPVRHLHDVDPNWQSSPWVVHIVPVIGCVAGHMPHAHWPPFIPPAQVHVVVPYMHGSAPQTNPPPMHAPMGCVAGHVGHVVQVQTGLLPPPQSHTMLPYVHIP
jgi:hypothetical protein